MWFLFSILTAFFESLKDVSSKKALKNIDEYYISWSLRFISSIFLIPILLFFIDIPSLKKPFFLVLLIAGIVDSVTTILYMKAIKHSDLSLSIPLLTFTPLFLLITSPIMLGEFHGLIGILGVTFIVAGSYILNISEKEKGYLIPFQVLFREKGSKLMLIVAFIWGITSNSDKIGIKYSFPLIWTGALNLTITVFLFPIVLFKPKNNMNQLKTNFMVIIFMGLFSALSGIFQMLAIKVSLVPYVISIKRTSVIMAVIFGYLFFKEKRIKERLSGVLIMLTGVFLITMSKN